MKIKELRVKNLRKISDAVLKFDKPLICLYGDVQQGKTTFLDAIKILFSSGFPSDLIQHGKDEASIELVLENGIISRSFYVSKEGEIKGRALNAIVKNEKLKAKELQNMFNPFQLNQDFLKEMTATERKKYFVELFNVDTAEIDRKIKEKETFAKELRAEIKGFGNPLEGVEEVKEPDLSELQQKEKAEKERLNKMVLSNRAKNAELKANWQIENDKHLQEIQNFNRDLQSQKEQNTKVIELHTELLKFKTTPFIDCIDFEKAYKIYANLPDIADEKPITNLPEPKYLDEKEGCDTSDLEKIQAEISNAKANQIKFENYQKALSRQSEKELAEKELKAVEENLRKYRKEKISKLAEYGKEIEGLQFDENGDLTFEGIANDNLSTSQIVRLGSLLSKLYPDSLLDLELIDRGESLGKKIWDFIEKAKKEEKTILATIVGERPANVPENLGVFVVENGDLI